MTTTSEYLLSLVKKTERGLRGFPGPPGAVTGGVYPSAGIALSSGIAWSASITNNSANWNTAYGWGNHASAGYAPLASPGLTTMASVTHATNPYLRLVKSNATARSIDLQIIDDDFYITDVTGSLHTLVIEGGTGILNTFGGYVAHKDVTGVNGITINPAAGAIQQIYSDYFGAGTERALVLGSYTYNANQLYLDTNGRVGILNVAPAHELDVTGTICASGDIVAYHV